tara:strand:+ start:604 stop:1332 length:729 start_codon:yes stop_codon:yes gene_type:complete
MKQLIYYVKLTDGTELIGITRNETIEKINNHFKNEKYFKPISISVLDRLIINGKSNAFIETANKQPINDYYKTSIEEFILNDKKQRTDDAMKKAINRYVNKLYYGNVIIKTTEIINDKIEPINIVNDDITTTDIDAIKTDYNLNSEIEPIDIIKPNDEIELINDETDIEVKIDDVDDINDYIEPNSDNSDCDSNCGLNDAFLNYNMGLLLTNDKIITKPKNETLRNKTKQNRNKSIKRNKVL